MQVVGTHDLRDPDQLIVVIMAMKKRLFLEHHTRQRAPQTPQIQTVVIILVVDQKLGSLEVPGSNSHIVLLVRVVKLGEAPIDEPQLSVSVVDAHVVRFHVAVHDAHGVAEV